MTFRLSRRWALLAAILGLAAPAAFSQTRFPDRPINWIVGFPPGGSADVMTRLVAKKLEAKLGQAVVIENRPGASGSIALQAAAKASPDGYTLITVPGPVLTTKPQPELGKELMGIAMLGKGPMVLVGTLAQPLPATLNDLLASARSNPDKYSFASSGNGTSQHFAGELVNQMAGTKMTHIPYKGGNQAVTDVIGGQVPLAVLGITPVLPHIRSGKLRAYGVSTAARSPALPDVPSFREASGLAAFDASQWFVVAAASGVPADRVQVLNAAISDVLKDPDVANGFATVGVQPEAASAQGTTAFVAADLKRWRELAARSNLPLE